MFSRELEQLEQHIRQGLVDLGSIAPDSIEWTPLPFAGQWGMGTTACFQAAAAEARSGRGVSVPARAEALARQLAERVKPPRGINRLAAEKAYVNAYFDTPTFAGRVVGEPQRLGADFGRGAARGERVMVEYAQPNTHHSIHIGHARTAVLGESLARIVEFAGFETIRASYPGDMGLGVITCVWAYQKFYQGQEPEGVHERGRWLAGIYAEATALLEPKEGETAEERERREGYDRERRDMLRRWTEKDPQVWALWEKTRQWSLDELQDILAMLDIHMDVFFYESEVEDLARKIVDELIALGVAEDERPSGGPVIVRIDEKLGLKKEKYRTAVLLRSDGTTLYLTKDLALAKVKFQEYKVDRSIYVVDFRQSLHFQQAFKILELWGFPQAAKCFHLSYGFVTLPEGAMSSRRGNVVFFKDVADEAVRRVLATIEQKNPDMPQDLRPVVARQVGMGALAYAMLSVDNTKDIVFEYDTALSLEGQSAPYIQNAHVRANSILRKAGAWSGEPTFDYVLTQHEVDLIDLLSQFPRVVDQAANEYKPLLMANYAFALARTFHGFYHSVPVLQAEDEQRRLARLHLTAAVRQTLANSLRLLVIQAPDVM
ncbi:MAG TPA: arginine--tRNA ligase [Anaerolineales bacterium]|nr:arginine--tRNA ligase [Anaerolineales bacterium]